MNPLLKWPGGKTGEIAKIQDLIPAFDRYIEPFFGGGALFFHIAPQRAVINDISGALMDFYALIQAQDGILRAYLKAYSQSLARLICQCGDRYAALGGIYGRCQRGTLEGGALREELGNLVSQILAASDSPQRQVLVLDSAAFAAAVRDGALDKLKRTVRNQRKKPFSEADLRENLITGFASGYYTYFRKVYNDLLLGRGPRVSRQYAAANFCFIREYCYGSMFRYNAQGEFNVPYGGMSYNRKNFGAKIDHMFSRETADIFRGTQIYAEDFQQFFEDAALTPQDFMFLDPPYDTDFSDYEGKDFTPGDQVRLALALRRTPAKFILIIKNTEFIYNLYRDYFTILTFENRYTYNVRSRNDRNTQHLIITNLPVAL